MPKYIKKKNNKNKDFRVLEWNGLVICFSLTILLPSIFQIKPLKIPSNIETTVLTYSEDSQNQPCE